MSFRRELYLTIQGLIFVACMLAHTYLIPEIDKTVLDLNSKAHHAAAPQQSQNTAKNCTSPTPTKTEHEK